MEERILASLDEIAELLKSSAPKDSMGDFIALITVCVTLLLGVLGFIFNSLIQRRNNSIKVITEDRVARRKATQEVVERFLLYADPVCLKQVVSIADKKQVMEDCTKCVVKLRSLYTFTSEHDIDLVFAARDLKDEIYCILYERKPCEECLKSKTENFIKMADLCMTTEWKRIKREAKGKYRNGNKGYTAWNDIWDEHEGHYDRNLGIKAGGENFTGR